MYSALYTLNKSIVTLVLLCGLAVIAHAQKLEWRKDYYDANEQKVKTAWQVLSDKPQVFNGKYLQYYINGTQKAEGFYSQNQQSGLWKYYYENGQVKVECTYSRGAMNGSYKSFNTNGSISKEGSMSSSVPNGLWKQYHETGTLKSEGNYFKGKVSGTWISYYEDGTKKSITTYMSTKAKFQEFYENGNPKMVGILKNNISDSIWNYYYENGKLKATGNEKNGLKNGLWTFYYDDGKIESEGTYLNVNTKGQWKYYHSNGKLSSVGKYEMGQKEGEWKLYFESGALQGEGVFAAGNGNYQEYYESGKLKVKGKVEDGQYIGNWTFYDENGVREGICEYESGLGKYTGFYTDGRVKMTGTLKNSEKIGTWKLYDPKGDLIGTFRSYSDAMNAPQAYVPKDTTKRFTTLNQPKLIQKKPFYFLPRTYETTRLSIGINPLAIFLNQLPIYIEYFIPNRTGIEMTFCYIHSPLGGNFTSPAYSSTYTDGYSVNFGPKFYKRDKGSGSLFFKPSVRYSSFSYKYNMPFGKPISYNNIYKAEEKLYEITVNGGWKSLLPLANYRYLTFELFVGAGFGFRVFKKPSDLPVEVFSELSDTQNPILFRLGGSLAYCF